MANLLPGYGVLRASGPDADAFLHAQLASDVRALAPGAWQWSCYLTPQGRTQSVFVLFRAAASEFLLAVPGELAEAVRERLARYRLRSKVELTLDPQWRVAGALPGCDRGSVGADALVAEIPGSRSLCVTREPLPAAGPDTIARWALADIATGVPVLTSAVTDGHTPQALSLDRLAAYSVKKGCYPGQEIVARTHFLGRSKRALARFECAADALPAPGSELVAGGSNEALGTLISAAHRGSGAIELLAVVRFGHTGMHLAGASENLLQALSFEP